MMSNCVRDAHNHNNTILRPDLLIKKLIDAGLFDEDALLGRIQFGNIQRTGLNVTMRYLVYREQELKDFIEDQTDYDADEAFNVLCFGVILSVMQGSTEVESPIIENMQSVVSKLPHAMVQRLMTSQHNIRQLLK
jgi:hypothetical protein